MKIGFENRAIRYTAGGEIAGVCLGDMGIDSFKVLRMLNSSSKESRLSKKQNKRFSATPHANMLIESTVPMYRDSFEVIHVVTEKLFLDDAVYHFLCIGTKRSVDKYEVMVVERRYVTEVELLQGIGSLERIRVKHGNGMSEMMQDTKFMVSACTDDALLVLCKDQKVTDFIYNGIRSGCCCLCDSEPRVFTNINGLIILNLDTCYFGR